jgi:tRNA threonylcarbamoyl adenosine modification protein YeaZ
MVKKIMKILAFDTTNATLSVAILFDEKTIAQKNILESNQHSSLLIPSIEECLNSAEIWYSDLDLIAFTNGPGSFTGIRVGFSCAKALAISIDAPILAVSSLAAIAYAYLESGRKNHSSSEIMVDSLLGASHCASMAMGVSKILVVNDARLDEFFVQEFDVKNGQLKSLFDPVMIKAEQIGDYLPKEKFILAGSGKNLIQEGLENATIFPEVDFIDAVNIALLAQDTFEKDGVGEENQALYIRKPKISQRKRKV